MPIGFLHTAPAVNHDNNHDDQLLLQVNSATRASNLGRKSLPGFSTGFNLHLSIPSSTYLHTHLAADYFQWRLQLFPHHNRSG